MTDRSLPRLTAAEWDALTAAVALAEVEWQDIPHGRDAPDAEHRRQLRALDRAYDKVREAMTTPGVREQAFVRIARPEES